MRNGQNLLHESQNFTNIFLLSHFTYNLSNFLTSLKPHYQNSFFYNFFLFSTLNSRISKNMCIWRHKLCNAKTVVGPTFTWSNEPWYMRTSSRPARSKQIWPDNTEMVPWCIAMQRNTKAKFHRYHSLEVGTTWPRLWPERRARLPGQGQRLLQGGHNNEDQEFKQNLHRLEKCHLPRHPWWCEIFRVWVNLVTEHTVFCHKVYLFLEFSLSFSKSSRKWREYCFEVFFCELVVIYKCISMILSDFKASALWADAFYKSKCPSVCLSVCPSVHFWGSFKCFFAPTVWCPIFFEIQNRWGKIMEKSGLRLEHFCLKVV